jgi:hypothetical protein
MEIIFVDYWFLLLHGVFQEYPCSSCPPMNLMTNPNTARTREYNKSIDIIGRTNTKTNIGKYDYRTHIL